MPSKCAQRSSSAQKIVSRKKNNLLALCSSSERCEKIGTRSLKTRSFRIHNKCLKTTLCSFLFSHKRDDALACWSLDYYWIAIFFLLLWAHHTNSIKGLFMMAMMKLSSNGSLLIFWMTQIFWKYNLIIIAVWFYTELLSFMAAVRKEIFFFFFSWSRIFFIFSNSINYLCIVGV